MHIMCSPRMDLEDNLYYYKKCEVFVRFFHFENGQLALIPKIPLIIYLL